MSALQPPYAPEIDICPDGDRMTVVVRGELDLEVAPEVERALREALGRSVRGVDLDLSGVEFCDCSALNIMLGLRHRALREAKTLVVRSTGPVAERLLTLTGTDSLFAPADEDEDADDDDPESSPDGTEDLARGILMASFGLKSEDAWNVLVMASQNTNTKLHHLARDLVSTVGGEALSEPLQKQVSAAVAKINCGRGEPPPA